MYGPDLVKAITDERVSNFDWRLLSFMAARVEWNNLVHLKQVKIAKALRVAPSQISRSLKHLESLGYVACFEQGTYFIEPTAIWKEPAEERERALEMGMDNYVKLLQNA
jgi:predicted transcriptional regulator of viral defense system